MSGIFQRLRGSAPKARTMAAERPANCWTDLQIDMAVSGSMPSQQLAQHLRHCERCRGKLLEQRDDVAWLDALTASDLKA